ncbi:MAG TPA: rhomboid family intramembrane serine protease, partial [Burkholderiaceae bacterium]|nr:rhomboid family intramembrane serine protease [Burkholderiaceae bacterium]
EAENCSMLLLPYSDKSVARSFPVVTTLLVVVCTVVLFAFQSRDALREQHAFEFYHESGLDKIELPRYEEYLASSNETDATERLRLLHHTEPGSLAAARLLQSDAMFQRALHAKHVVREDDPAYAAWSVQRQRFDGLLNSTVQARFCLERYEAQEVWRFVTYSFLHGGIAHWLGNMLVLVLVGPFVEAALGRFRFATAYLAGGAAAGALHVLVSDSAVIGASGAIAATIGMLAVLYGTRKVPVFYWVFIVFGTAQIPALALLPIWLINEGYQWSLQARGPLSGATVAYGAHVGGLVAGAILARLWRPRTPAGISVAAANAEQRRADAGSTLAAQAQDAASRLDIRRATRLYRELVELEPKRTEHLGAYLNVALLGADEDVLQDAALRLLWAKIRSPTDELRKTFLQLTQPKILKVLPIDEHLRLARRLVRYREDAAALRVIDALLRDDHLRELYGRQLADCLLGLFTAYTRQGLNRQVEQINVRLGTYFPTNDQMGGMAPTKRAPSTLLSAMRPTAGGLSMRLPDSQLAPTTARSDKYGS